MLPLSILLMVYVSVIEIPKLKSYRTGLTAYNGCISHQLLLIPGRGIHTYTLAFQSKEIQKIQDTRHMLACGRHTHGLIYLVSCQAK